jgi:hypothetical protein
MHRYSKYTDSKQKKKSQPPTAVPELLAGGGLLGDTQTEDTDLEMQAGLSENYWMMVSYFLGSLYGMIDGCYD